MPPGRANAVTFIPTGLLQKYQGMGLALDHKLPSITFINSKGVPTPLEWGFKIYPDGKFFVNFFGIQDYYDLGNSEEFNITYPHGKTVPLSKLGEGLKNIFKTTLQDNIDFLKKEGGPKQLSQQETTLLLMYLAEKAPALELEWSIFFTADYAVDRSGLVKFLSANASQHYRQAFTLEADPHNIFKITEATL